MAGVLQEDKFEGKVDLGFEKLSNYCDMLGTCQNSARYPPGHAAGDWPHPGRLLMPVACMQPRQLNQSQLEVPVPAYLTTALNTEAPSMQKPHGADTDHIACVGKHCI